jgi:hypothetical protein
MNDYNIRFADYSDIPAIMKYIDTYWRKDHILARDRKLFEWQYVNYGRVNFVVGTDENGDIQGILGYIPYDNNDDKDIAIALWKANKSAAFLGIRLLMFLIKEEKHKNIICTGINMSTTPKIYEQFGMKVVRMNHWYRLCKGADYVIGKIADTEIPEILVDKFTLHMIDSADDLDKVVRKINVDSVPRKSEEYLKKRYFDHPAYRYYVYGICGENAETVGLLVIRIQEFNKSKVIRFVDFIGEQSVLAGITGGIDVLLKQFAAEYIDMYETGLDEDILLKAGWKETGMSGNIIPNYFAPFEQKNVDIFCTTSDAGAVLFRGDGDQDRPN